MNYLINNLTEMSGGLGDSLNNMRKMIANIRGFTSNIIQNIFGVFSNLIIEFQKILIAIKDMVGKIIGVLMVVMYIMDGSIKTMHSMWNGPPGDLVRSIGSCFHPETKIKLQNGEKICMKDISLGDILCL
jgi:hypothetical protein